MGNHLSHYLETIGLRFAFWLRERRILSRRRVVAELMRDIYPRVIAEAQLERAIYGDNLAFEKDGK